MKSVNMKKLINDKGLTFIEVIVSIAIIGIIAVSFLSIFSNSFVQVVQSGNQNSAAYSAQTFAEDLLENSTFSDSDATSVTVVWGSNYMSVEGNLETVAVDIPNDPDNEQAILKVFITKED